MSMVFRAADALGDRLNPIVVRELRQSVRSRFVVVGLQLLLALLVFVMAIAVITTSTSTYRPTDFGAELFTILFTTLQIIAMLIVPVYTGVRLALEQSGSDLMFISTIRPRAIVYGKLWSAMILALLLFSATMPFMTLCYLLRGIDIPTMAWAMFWGYVRVIAVTSFWILWGALPLGWPARIAIVIVGAIVSLFLLGGMLPYWFYHGFSGASPYGMGASSTWEAWASSAAYFSLVGLLMALALELATAALSPPSSNRMMPPRVLMTAQLVLSGLVLWFLAWLTGDNEWVAMWLVLQITLGVLFLVIAVCERDDWGPRIRRGLPRDWLWRAVIFPFHTGSLNGILWYVGAMLFLLVGSQVVRDQPVGYRADGFLIMSGWLLFIYAYCVSGGIVHRYLLRRYLATHFTWVVVLLLFAALCALPPVVAFVVSPNDMMWMDEDSIFFLPNPVFLADYRAADGVRPLNFLFAAFWSAVATAVAIPWFWRQATRFRSISAEELARLSERPAGESPFAAVDVPAPPWIVAECDDSAGSEPAEPPSAP